MVPFSINHLTQLGIQNCTGAQYNCSYEELFEREIDASQDGDERGVVTQLGAVAVDTGKFTGRSPRDKYVVRSQSNQDTVWWADEGSDNKPISQETWSQLKKISVEQLSKKQLFVMDGFCGANPETRLSVRLVTEVAWMAHFFKNMFIRPTDDELATFKPDWTILNACKTTCKNYASYGLNSENYVAFNLEERMTVIGGTWYGGEIKKGIFSIMNYFLPLKGIGSFHCSANMGSNGDTALFFGLSGTGKTTLSTDPKRKLIGDDEHGWDDDGVFNLEGGCYAKTIDLTRDTEPDIYDAIRRNALLENVVVKESGEVDFESSSKTQNTRVSYPIHHIENIVKPVSKGAHPKQVIFLTCDAYGVLPPVSKLSKEQAMYQFLSGYTAKVAGTELGVKEPVATFSACFGQPFLLQHPTRYAEILGQKMEQHGSEAYLVNTGWTGGQYGVGKRTDLKDTRKIIDGILNGTLATVDFEVFPVFNLLIPKEIKGVDSRILNPRNTWADKEDYDRTLNELAKQFIDNFKQFTNTAEGKLLEQQFHAGLIAA